MSRRWELRPKPVKTVAASAPTDYSVTGYDKLRSVPNARLSTKTVERREQINPAAKDEVNE